MSKIIKEYLKQTVVLTVIIFSIIFVIWEGLSIYNTFFKVTSETTVPNIVGKNYHEAKSLLRKADLNLVVIESRFAEDVAENTVLEQNPSDGRKVKKGRDVLVIVSCGPDMSSTPNLIGLSLREGKVMLANYKLELGNVEKVSVPEVEPEHIFKQFPEAGTRVKRGSKIDLSVNAGAEPKIEVPNFVGKNILDARKELEKISLKTGQITWVAKEETYRGDIISQSIEPGQYVYPKTFISFNVSIGSPTEIWKIKQERINFLVPSGYKDQSVKIIVNDETGSNIVYTGKHIGGEELELSLLGIGEAEYVIYVNEQVEKRAKF